jgi:tRNA U38,U39,U40 pseudouridine synthase TruA
MNAGEKIWRTFDIKYLLLRNNYKKANFDDLICHYSKNKKINLQKKIKNKNNNLFFQNLLKDYKYLEIHIPVYAVDILIKYNCLELSKFIPNGDKNIITRDSIKIAIINNNYNLYKYLCQNIYLKPIVYLEEHIEPRYVLNEKRYNIIYYKYDKDEKKILKKYYSTYDKNISAEIAIHFTNLNKYILNKISDKYKGLIYSNKDNNSDYVNYYHNHIYLSAIFNSSEIFRYNINKNETTNIDYDLVKNIVIGFLLNKNILDIEYLYEKYPDYQKFDMSFMDVVCFTRNYEAYDWLYELFYNKKKGFVGKKLLCGYSSKGNFEVVRFICEYAKIKDNIGLAILEAKKYGYMEIVKYLLPIFNKLMLAD